MYNGEEELQSAMLERQKEMDMYELERQKRQKSRKQKGKYVDSPMQSENTDPTDLSDIAKTMKAFVNKVSSYKGAEIPENRDSDDVELNVDRLIKEMETVIRNDSPEGTSSATGLEEATSSSSDMDFDASDDDLSDSEPSESMETGDSFMQSYSDALSDQLKDSTLRKSFLHANGPTPSTNISQGLPTSSAEVDADFTPVDMDVNLVQSLIDSFSSQQGLPGPASNLLGLLGLQLPRDSSEKK
ncbi:ecdysoneless-like protein [Nymphaea thermarum]|nr:ecdysoneless-like protein [Nymphaea thermarum]